MEAFATSKAAATVGGRIFFSNASRSLVEEDELELTTVGVDIGSSTSHMLLSRIVLERQDTRYVVKQRETLFQSEILLTPYTKGEDIDADALAKFIDSQYAASGIKRSEIDTGALILTGVAVRRKNARKIGELFAADAGKFVSVSAGDQLETILSAHGSGALASSKETGKPIANIDIGGGTTKIALCVDGQVVGVTAVEAGARLIAFDSEDRILRLEPFGKKYLELLGISARQGDTINQQQREQIAQAMVEQIILAATGGQDKSWLRLAPLDKNTSLSRVGFSGGVAEYLYQREQQNFGDLGPDIARIMAKTLEDLGLPVTQSVQGIRATVVGASQYSVQVSGSTIFLDPDDILPMRNLPVIKLDCDLSADELDPAAISQAIKTSLEKFNLENGDKAVAVTIPWQGSASFGRLDGLSRGLVDGLSKVLAEEHPLAMVVDGDIGGLLGMHCRENTSITNAIISIDAIELKEFDFIDIGEVIKATGSVPVVIKSLIFPGQ